MTPETDETMGSRGNQYFTSTTSNVFALRNLSEEVKGALFARYSRSAKTLQQLFEEEFAEGTAGEAPKATTDVGAERARRLYAKVLGEYGDDSVAQLGSAHVACEGVSNVLTKILERGRLMSYLEQSTRYVPYTDRPHGHWKYVTPQEIGDPETRHAYQRAMNGLFRTYATWLPRAEEHFRHARPRGEKENEAAYGRAIRAKALDTVRGLLPAATRSSLGIHGSGQAFEALLLRLGSSELHEARSIGQKMHDALGEVIPAFVSRLDKDERRRRWEAYRYQCEDTAREIAESIERNVDPEGRNAMGLLEEVRLTEHDADGEAKVIAAALKPHSHHDLHALTRYAKECMSPERRIEVLRRLAGTRENRRHRPGRGFENTSYVFEVRSDYGAFRDLQRHRMLTIDWERLGTRRGCARPPAIEEMGARAAWDEAMNEAEAAHEMLHVKVGPAVAQYAVPMAFRIAFTMRLNAREAMHMLELRTQPAGHATYRRICQEMHRLIRDEAGHTAIAAAMSHVNHHEVGLERMGAEQRSAERRQPAG